MSGDVEWSNELAVSLIQEYRKKPELWDSSHDLFRLQASKYEAWSDLAAVFECDIASIRRKLNSIFASHRREKAKVRCGGKSNWFLYPYMKFLPSHLDNENNTDAVYVNPLTVDKEEQIEEYEVHYSEEDKEDDWVQEVEVKEEPKVITTYISKPSKRSKPKVSRLLKRKENKNTKVVDPNLDSKLLETLKILKRSDLTRKKDECDSFGEYIAESLRKHDDKTQAMIKQAINNIIFEQEMKKYSHGQYIVVSTIDENPLICEQDTGVK